jgi:hypothetical protein
LFDGISRICMLGNIRLILSFSFPLDFAIFF